MKNWLFLLMLCTAHAASFEGRVVDSLSKAPLKGALVTLGNTVVSTDPDGKFTISANGDNLAIRACGYLRHEVATNTLSNDAAIPLQTFAPKALYLSLFGFQNKLLRDSALNLIADTELNALVIDVKDDMGRIAFRHAANVGDDNFRRRLGELHASGIYLIARIVVFKDNALVAAKPELAVRTAGGAIWQDREGQAWSNPFSQAVWDYNIDLAVEAAQAGFDEIQFDYVRFPDVPGWHYDMQNTEENRVAAIAGFLAKAREKLIPYNVFLAADIFGYVAWNSNDTDIGQTLGSLAPVLDYISPMLYPSGFQYGIPGYPDPIQHPHEIVYFSLEKAKQRTKLSGIRFRPWLQAFRDYAFDRSYFQGAQIRAQINAAERAGSDGWMLWNPRNAYSSEGLRPAPVAK